MKRITKVTALMLALFMAFGSVTALAGEKKPVYVVIGDSIAAGTGLSNPESTAYGAIVANTNGYEYINYAVPGYTTGNLLKLLKEEDVRQDLARADIIGISIGGNNFLLGGLMSLIIRALAFKDYSKFDEIAQGVYDDFCEIMAEIKSLNSTALIITQSLYNPRYDFLREAYQQGANRLNAVFTKYLSENPGSYVTADIATIFDGREELIASDSIHPNVDGHFEIAKAMLNILYELGYGTQTEPVVASIDPSKTQNTWELFWVGIKSLIFTIINMIGL